MFHLVRHGAYALLNQGFGGRQPYPLSEEGRAQAETIAMALSTRPIGAVISSPVQRALETAAPIGVRVGLPVQVHPDFAEIDFGDWSGARFDALQGEAGWRCWHVFRGTASIPNGETMHAVQARVLTGLMQLVAAYPDNEVVVVSHADVIKAALAHFLGAPLDLLRRMEIGPGSISQIQLYKEDAKVLAMNLPP